MKFNKLVSKSIIAIALLGTTFGVTFNASANEDVNQGATNTQQPQSNAKEHVSHNTLTLDTVPDFNFNNQNGDSNNLQLSQDGNLKISDYRASDDPNTYNNNKGASAEGWGLKATANIVNQSQEDNNNWELSLNQKALTNSSDPNIPTASNEKINSNFNLDTTGNEGSSSNLISNGGYGLTDLTYRSNSDDALLKIPNVHPGDYNMTINWTLSPNMSNQD